MVATETSNMENVIERGCLHLEAPRGLPHSENKREMTVPD